MRFVPKYHGIDTFEINSRIRESGRVIFSRNVKSVTKYQLGINNTALVRKENALDRLKIEVDMGSTRHLGGELEAVVAVRFQPVPHRPEPPARNPLRFARMLVLLEAQSHSMSRHWN